MELNNINSLVLAYLGDSVYELYIREYLIKRKLNKVNDLQKEAIKYVCAKSQSEMLRRLINDEILNESELSIVKRARNSKVTSSPKNTDILTYKHATAFEALIGYLYLKEDINRLEIIMGYILEEK